MSKQDGAVAAQETEDLDEVDEISREMALALHLGNLCQILAARQAEVLRISEFVQTREVELHDAKLRAKRMITQELSEVNEDVLDRLIEIFQEAESPASGEGDDALSSVDKLDAIQAAFQEVSTELNEGVTQTYISSILRSLRPAVGVDFLYSSLLMTLVGELEMFINQLARVAFEYNPSRLKESQRSFKWAEIAEAGSFDVLRDELVDSTVEELLHGSLTDWVEFFEKRFEIPKIKAARDWTALEVIQRRNCVVHNGGLVSQKYIDKLSGYNHSMELDDELKVDADYVAKAADSLFLVAYSLTWALADKTISENEAHETAIGDLTNRTMHLLQEGRHDLVKQICDAAPHKDLERKPDYESFSWILHINRWLAFKELGQFENVRAEVASFSVHSKDDRFKMAKAALLDEVEEATMFARSLRERGDLKLAHILAWPLLRGIRDQADWAK